MSAHTWRRDAGVVARVEDVAAWAKSTGLGNIVLSGGEPFDQAPALSRLLDELREGADWVATSFSGYQRSTIEQEVRPGSRELLARLDVLIDGPYRPELHASLRWRGSSNQQIHVLSDRVPIEDDNSAGLMVPVAADGSFDVIGVPPSRQAMTKIRSVMQDAGVAVQIAPRVSRFPFPVRPVPPQGDD